jgi:hypothetical protein
LGKRLADVEERLPELLERVLDEETHEKDHISADEREIVEILTRNPSAETVLAMKPSEQLQARTSELLARNKQSELTSAEEFELERYLTLEH